MLQLLSFAMSAAVLVISIGAIVATVRAELPFILRALGVTPVMPPLRPEGERRVRVTRQPQARSAVRSPLRAAA